MKYIAVSIFLYRNTCECIDTKEEFQEICTCSDAGKVYLDPPSSKWNIYRFSEKPQKPQIEMINCFKMLVVKADSTRRLDSLGC
jgi:hypothetical protein